jgi:pyruvate/2-oxoglutarate dehydrogenase complex dihydrolipoamide acyltransferase (E2) component
LTRELTFNPSDTDSEEFTVSYWKLDVGARVNEGDELLVVESVDEKTALTVLSPYAGTLTEIAVGEEETVRPGDLLGRIEDL